MVLNILDALQQMQYAINDNAPIESILATFWWHLTH